jgi:hypothetical protein
MRRMNRTLGVTLIIALVLAYVLTAFFTGALDFTFKQWTYALRSLFPDISALGVNHNGLRWAMIVAVTAMYPLTILWHWGAQALPRGELNTDGESAADAVLTRSAGSAADAKPSEAT